MRMIDPILAELEAEAETTKRVLERVPQDKLAWKPHEKSLSLGQLAHHVAALPGDVSNLVAVDQVEVPDFTFPEAEDAAALLKTLHEGVAKAKGVLNDMDDQALMSPWKATRGGREVMSIPKIGLVRSIMLNHWYHHRGQLVVYLRLQGIPLPSVYGPTADENPFAL